MKVRSITVLMIGASLAVALAGCAEEKVDPLAVTNSATITNITDNTDTGWYTVDSAVLSTNAIGTTLELAFTIVDANHANFSPISTLTFSDGTVLTCQADDLRRVPSLVKNYRHMGLRL